MCVAVELEMLADTKPAFLAHSHVHQSGGTLYYLSPVPDYKDLVTENKGRTIRKVMGGGGGGMGKKPKKKFMQGKMPRKKIGAKKKGKKTKFMPKEGPIVIFI